jgi:hypothetical protein
LNGDHCGVIEQPGLELSLWARWAANNGSGQEGFRF